MEPDLPHVVLRVFHTGIGADLVAALCVHPVAVSEARDAWDMHRLSDGRPPLLVVVADPPDARAAVRETRAVFPGVPILIASHTDEPSVAGETGHGSIDTVPSDRPIQDICWCVLEAISRAAGVSGVTDHPLGPRRIEVDDEGIVVTGAATPEFDRVAFLGLRPGDSLPAMADPLERPLIAGTLRRLQTGEPQFQTVRLEDDRGRRQVVALGLRRLGAGRVAVLVQPLTAGGAGIGRRIDPRDPITGLLTRWAMSRAIETTASHGAAEDHRLVLVSLDEFAVMSHAIGHRQTDDVLLGVASALLRVFPHPALTSRLMGDTFLACVLGGDEPTVRRRAEVLLRLLGRIEVPGLAPRFPLRASIGVAAVTDGDPDLALRLAQAAAAEAHAEGGNRVVVAGNAAITTTQARELTASMDLGSWEVWLQPVMRERNGRAAYHEALARFDVGRHLVSRADLFVAGRADGLLERFDRMMLLRALEILQSHPQARLSVNVSYETFVSQPFPASFLDPIGRLADGCRRIILEIAARCLMAPEELVRPRLERLADAGVAVAIDDFGSGICRLGDLTQWPLAMVKLDELVTGYVDADPLQREFVRTVTSLCHARGITTVAEYTRSEEQFVRLVDDGVDLFQGELFGMPRPATEVLMETGVAADRPVAIGPAAG